MATTVSPDEQTPNSSESEIPNLAALKYITKTLKLDQKVSNSQIEVGLIILSRP